MILRHFENEFPKYWVFLYNFSSIYGGLHLQKFSSYILEYVWTFPPAFGIIRCKKFRKKNVSTGREC